MKQPSAMTRQHMLTRTPVHGRTSRAPARHAAPVRLLAKLLPLPSRATRPAVPGGTRRDFFGDRLATFEELRAANDRATPRGDGATPRGDEPPRIRHVA